MQGAGHCKGAARDKRREAFQALRVRGGGGGVFSWGRAAGGGASMAQPLVSRSIIITHRIGCASRGAGGAQPAPTLLPAAYAIATGWQHSPTTFQALLCFFFQAAIQARASATLGGTPAAPAPLAGAAAAAPPATMPSGSPPEPAPTTTATIATVAMAAPATRPLFSAAATAAAAATATASVDQLSRQATGRRQAAPCSAELFFTHPAGLQQQRRQGRQRQQAWEPPREPPPLGRAPPPQAQGPPPLGQGQGQGRPWEPQQRQLHRWGGLRQRSSGSE